MRRPSLATVLFLTLLLVSALSAGSLLMKGGYIWVTALLAFVTLSTFYIFLKKNFLHFRFMYPGLLTFLLFMILPIGFSIYVGFTNLSTGHFLSQQQVHQLLLEETVISSDVEPLPFTVARQSDQSLAFQLKNQSNEKLVGRWFPDGSNMNSIVLAPGEEAEGRQLSVGEVFQLQDQLTPLRFLTPDGLELRYYRADLLAPVKQRFTELSDTSVKDYLTGVIYTADSKIGRYKSDIDSLAPGFFVNVGFKNFLTIWQSPHIRSSFFKVSIWTLIWASVSVLTTFCLGMALALFLNDKNLRFKYLYRVLLVLPYSIPFFISALIFKGMLNQDFGVINEGLKNIGLPAIGWLTDPLWAKVSALTVNLWLGFPYMFLLTTGILQSIPASLYEAAAIDGANRWQAFRKITLPMIMSAITPLLIGSFAFNLNNFVGIYLLTGGGPPIKGAITPVGETDILISYTYRLAFEGAQGQDFGLASSISLFIFVIIAILTLINFRMSGMMAAEAK